MASVGKRREGRLTPTQARSARRMRRHRRRRFIRVGGFTAILLVAFFFIASLFAPSLPISFGGTSYGEAGEEFSEQTYSPHIVEGAEHPSYNSKPATSGWHYDAPARWGIYDEFLPDERLVHNLEHGGIGIHYNCTDGCPELLSQLTKFATRTPGDWLDQYMEDLTESGSTGKLNRAMNVEGNYKVILSPYPEMDTRIALTSWTYKDSFDEFDSQRVIDFIMAHMSAPAAPEYTLR